MFLDDPTCRRDVIVSTPPSTTTSTTTTTAPLTTTIPHPTTTPPSTLSPTTPPRSKDDDDRGDQDLWKGLAIASFTMSIILLVILGIALIMSLLNKDKRYDPYMVKNCPDKGPSKANALNANFESQEAT